ncbi:MAG: hypothetical protein RSG77_21820 [Hafnia sp.]
MAFLIIEYRRKDYTLADAFRRDPKWGRRIFAISAEDLGTDDIEAVKACAALPESTPEGFVLHSVRDRDAKPAPDNT